MTTDTLRRPVTLAPELARAFSRYVATSVALGFPDARLWRLEVHRDRSVWITSSPDNERHRAQRNKRERRVKHSRTRLADSPEKATALLDSRSI